jgi:soluble lytic murein transglycosylase-like protein
MEELMKFVAALALAILIQVPSLPDDHAHEIAQVFVEVGRVKGIDPTLLAAIAAVESRYSYTAKSRSGACGTMQVLPQYTWEDTRDNRFTCEALYDPWIGVLAGADSYLAWLQWTEKRGSKHSVLAHYNQGKKIRKRCARKRGRDRRRCREYADKVGTRLDGIRRDVRKAIAQPKP